MTQGLDGRAGARGPTAPETTALVAVVLLAGLALRELRWALLPFVLAGLLAYLCAPFVDWLALKWRRPRRQCAVAVFLVLLAIAVAIGALGAPPLIREFERLSTDLQPTLRNLAQGTLGDRTVAIFGRPMNAEQFANAVATGLRDWIGQPDKLATAAGIGFAGFFGAILTFVLLFYLLFGGPEIMKGILWLAPVAARPTVERIWSRLAPLLWRYIFGVLIVVAYATIAAYVGLGVVLGLRHALFLALLTGVLEMVPVVGPGASAVIAGLVAVRNATGIGPILGYAAYVIALRLSIDQLLGPLVLGAAARLSPVVIIFCFLAGAVLFGVAGVILAVPAAIAIKTTLAVLRDDAPAPQSAR